MRPSIRHCLSSTELKDLVAEIGGFKVVRNDDLVVGVFIKKQAKES